MPAARVRAPESESPNMSEPEVMAYVKAGSAEPNTFVLASAITVIARGLTVKFWDTALAAAVLASPG